MTITSLLYRLARLAADVRAARRGRVPQRIANRAIGRAAGRGLRRLWR